MFAMSFMAKCKINYHLFGLHLKECILNLIYSYEYMFQVIQALETDLFALKPADNELDFASQPHFL